MSAGDDIADPEVLAAIEASRNEANNIEDDPMIRAALEESMREADDKGEEENDDEDREEKLKESDEPEDKTLPENDLNVSKDDDNSSTSKETSEDKEENDQKGDDDDNNGNEKSEINSALVTHSETNGDVNDKKENDVDCAEKTNGHSSEIDENGTDKKETDNENNENNETESQGGEIQLEGVPEIDENPFKDVEEDKDGDPLGKNDESDDDDDEDKSLAERKEERNRRNKSFKSERKRKRSQSSSDDEGSKKSLRPRGKSSKDILYRCPLCTFSTEVLGELIIHKFKEHDQQQKPSYLDLAEVVIASLHNNQGAKKDVVHELLEGDYSEYLNEDRKQSLQMLSRALEGGVQLGRLRKGGKGGAMYFMSGKATRKMVHDKWKANKRSVEYKDVKSIVEGSKEFYEIQAQLNKLNMMIAGGSRMKQRPRDESDDEICVVEEKITDKAKRRAEHRKKLIMQKKKQIAQQRALAAKNAGPKTVIKVNSAQGKDLLRKIVATGSVPKTAVKQSPPKKFQMDEDEDEGSLTCPVCMSSFWYPNQTLEHMKTAHNYDNPEKVIREKAKLRKK